MKHLYRSTNDCDFRIYFGTMMKLLALMIIIILCSSVDFLGFQRLNTVINYRTQSLIIGSCGYLCTEWDLQDSVRSFQPNNMVRQATVIIPISQIHRTVLQVKKRWNSTANIVSGKFVVDLQCNILTYFSSLKSNWLCILTFQQINSIRTTPGFKISVYKMAKHCSTFKNSSQFTIINSLKHRFEGRHIKYKLHESLSPFINLQY